MIKYFPLTKNAPNVIDRLSPDKKVISRKDFEYGA